MSEENVNQTSAPASEPVASAASKKKGSPLWIIVAVVAVLVVLLVVYQRGMLSGGTSGMDSGSEQGAGEPSSVVATVNGISITRGELDEKIQQIRQTIPEGAADPTQDALFETSILDEIINVKLLLGKADAMNISVADTDVDAEIATLVEVFGGQENFDAQLAANGLTLNQLKENMKNELLIRAVVNAETNADEVAVTDEEIAAAYELAVAGGQEGGPTLEQVSDILRAELVRQKTGAIVDAYLRDLRNEATIEISL